MANGNLPKKAESNLYGRAGGYADFGRAHGSIRGDEYYEEDRKARPAEVVLVPASDAMAAVLSGVISAIRYIVAGIMVAGYRSAQEL
jgi:hypothetical protein